jgi:HSP20 family protein
MTEIKENVNVEEKNQSQFEELLEMQDSIVPLTDIYETEDNFVLTANLPGVSKENVQLKLEDGSLTIFGKINYEEISRRKYVLNENVLGNYYRKFKLSDSIDGTKIEARFENGQLVVTLPKHERVKPKTISVN